MIVLYKVTCQSKGEKITSTNSVDVEQPNFKQTLINRCCRDNNIPKSKWNDYRLINIEKIKQL